MYHSNLRPFTLSLVCTAWWLFTKVDVLANICYPLWCQILLVQCRAQSNRTFCWRVSVIALISLLTAWGSQRKLLVRAWAEQSCGSSLMCLYFKSAGTPHFSQRDLLFHQTLRFILSIIHLQKAHLQRLAELSWLAAHTVLFSQHLYAQNVEPRSKIQVCVQGLFRFHCSEPYVEKCKPGKQLRR